MVISDRDIKFTSYFWKSLFVGLETRISFGTIYHPKRMGKQNIQTRSLRICKDVRHEKTHKVGGLFTFGGVHL